MNRLAIAAVALVAGAAGSAAQCLPEFAEIRTPRGTVAFSVEIADTDDERARGLMFRRDLPRDAGMLFLFEGEQPRAFWMKNTPLSLDMLHFDARGRLCGLVERARPFSTEALEGGCAAAAVLEINGGLARELGLGIGAEMRHPFFGKGAAWPCG